MIIVRSHIGYGAPDAVDTAGAHGSPLGVEEVAAAKRALGWDPDSSSSSRRGGCAHEPGRARGGVEREWQATFDTWSDAFPGERERWDAAWAGQVGEWAGRRSQQVRARDTRRPARRSCRCSSRRCRR